MPTDPAPSPAHVAALLNPRNVVLVGASERAENWSGRVWQNLNRFGFSGSIFPLNPNRAEIWGVRCYQKMDDLPEAPDHLALFIPADFTLQVLERGAAAGARSATLYAAGFGEGGDPAGRDRLAHLQNFARRAGFAVAGPNCMGIAVAASRFCTFADENLHELAVGPVAVIAQSGALCSTINRGINDGGLHTAYLLSCGNQANVTIGDYIDYLADDPALRVILCYIEQVRDPARFFAAARRAGVAGKTVVVVKIGGSDAGRKAALAHTGALAGAIDVFDAFARDAGIVRVETLEDAIVAVAYLARLPRPRGRRVAIMTNSGAVRSLSTEAASRAGVALPDYDSDTVRRLGTVLGRDVPTNPLDTKRTLSSEAYMTCVEALATSAAIDCVLVAEELPDVPGVARKLANLDAVEAWAAHRPVGSSTTPVALVTPLSLSETDYSRSLRHGLRSLPLMKGIEATLRVIGTMAAFTMSPEPPESPALPQSYDVFEPLRQRFAATDLPAALNEPESKALLKAYGIPVPEEFMVDGAAAAVAAANRLGYPVVVKGVSAALTHKSDAGMVVLDLTDASAVERAAQGLQARAATTGLTLDGLLVARQVPKGVETVLGIHRDVELGPVVMFGMGGIWVELLHDVIFGPPMLGRASARAMVDRTRVSRLLSGYRGAPPADIDTLLDALVAMGRMARDLPDFIESVELNPFIVCPKGQGGWASDALVVLGSASRDR